VKFKGQVCPPSIIPVSGEGLIAAKDVVNAVEYSVTFVFLCNAAAGATCSNLEVEAVPAPAPPDRSAAHATRFTNNIQLQK
jgi:hypothetical protein